MIGVERLVTALRTVAVSGLVKNGSPISVVIIAPPDAGKSELISKTLPPNARVINDFTTASMLTILNEPKPPTWIVVPDFNAVISHKQSVASLTMAFLLSLLAEGVTEIPGVDDRAKLIVKNFRSTGRRIALLTSMTPDMFYSRRGKWRSTGLLRRLVPINYTYSAQTVEEIQAAIVKGLDLLDYSQHRQKHMKARTIAIGADIATDIKSLSQAIIANQLVWRERRSADGASRVHRAHEFPFSFHKVFRNFAKSNALLHGRDRATRADFDALREFTKFVRYDRAEEL